MGGGGVVFQMDMVTQEREPSAAPNRFAITDVPSPIAVAVCADGKLRVNLSRRMTPSPTEARASKSRCQLTHVSTPHSGPLLHEKEAHTSGDRIRNSRLSPSRDQEHSMGILG